METAKRFVMSYPGKFMGEMAVAGGVRSSSDDSDQHNFIVAIDIGTAYTKAGWALRKHPDKVCIYEKWPSAPRQNRVPTAALYQRDAENDWKFEAFGMEAIDGYDVEEGSLPLFKEFKMDLHKVKKFGTEKLVKSSNIPRHMNQELSLPAIRIFSDILNDITEMLCEHLRRIYTNPHLKKSEIKWVLTVPAIWQASARDFMRQAARKAVLYDVTRPRQLALALEPECAALYVRSLQKDELLLGEPTTAKKYIVIDVGGGTIDVAVHEVREHETTRAHYVSEIASCIGSSEGATVIDAEFLAYLQSELPIHSCKQFFQNTKKCDPCNWTKVGLNFIKAKETYKGKKELLVELPTGLFTKYKEEECIALDEALNEVASPAAYIKAGSRYLRISKELCYTWYQRTVGEIIRLIESLSLEHRINTVFLVGGFADSEVLISDVQKRFKGLQLVVPDNPGLAVIKGAVRYGPAPKAIANRKSQATYGIRVNEPFQTWHDARKKFTSRTTGKVLCADLFSVFISRGREVDPSEPILQIYEPGELDSCSVGISLYASNSIKPVYTDENQCVKIGSLAVPVKPLPPSATTEVRQVNVTFDFSGPEIFVQATTVDADGLRHTKECTVDFLPVTAHEPRQSLATLLQFLRS